MVNRLSVKVSAPRMDGLSGGSGECLDCPASVAGAEGWRGVFQQPAKVIPESQPPAEAQRLIEDEDEDELAQEDAPSHVRAILALAQAMRGSRSKVSLLQWKQERLDMRLLDDSAWLMYCYPRLRELGMEAEFVVPVAGDIFGVNELFDDILVSSTTQETTA